MYSFLKEEGIDGFEIAPTRIFPENPYGDLERVAAFKTLMKEAYNLKVISLQSICFGRSEAIFSTEQERNALLDYIKLSIDFASVLECRNLVFGSPKNRIIGEGMETVAVDYFSQIGQYAEEKNTVFAFEPNPVIYGTNFINTTSEALAFVKKCDVKGLKVNFDLGTVIYNNESLSVLEDNLDWINHIHISEPYLEVIQHRSLHNELADILRKKNYSKYVSVEMKGGTALEKIKDTIHYIKDAFKN
ncbi:MAG TPA: sugar phosphate isomerase/epimerase family protein [Flavobacterium sp.]|uniref:sugar phosphate isomerase/epimerase family protein n=1 Tax=Flavobacterium sp. TaxID=239 RepID=UPI002C1056D1|nr:sugar phosphate isomerase/epimerase family protein [Flavobacterium sp.]HSD14313.1 sugar phosphate isomerase/epimerase family protein [Flavobacterium sp.]